jgi:hypothetical protein
MPDTSTQGHRPNEAELVAARNAATLCTLWVGSLKTVFEIGQNQSIESRDRDAVYAINDYDRLARDQAPPIIKVKGWLCLGPPVIYAGEVAPSYHEIAWQLARHTRQRLEQALWEAKRIDDPSRRYNPETPTNELWNPHSWESLANEVRRLPDEERLQLLVSHIEAAHAQIVQRGITALRATDPTDTEREAKQSSPVTDAPASETAPSTPLTTTIEADDTNKVPPTTPLQSTGGNATNIPLKKGPFDLIIDENRRTVKRGKWTTEFNSRHLPWCIFLRLARRYDAYYKTSDLTTHAWEDANDCYCNDEHNLHVHIGTVRKLLRAVRLTVKHKKQLGYRLEKLSGTDTKRKSTRSQKRSRAKR